MEPEVPKKKVKKVKKSSKKVKKSAEEEADLEIDPNNQTMTRSRTHALVNQTLNKTEQMTQAECDEPESQPKKTKKTKKSTKKEPKENEEQEVIETRYEIREDGKKVKIKRVKKKVVKESQSEDKDEKKIKKVKKTKKKKENETKESKSESNDEKANLSNEQIEEVNNFKLELNESNEMLKENEPVCQQAIDGEISLDNEQPEYFSQTKQEEEKHQSIKIEETKEVIDSSLITNDEEKTENEPELENPNVTRDIINTTFEKKDEPEQSSTLCLKSVEKPVLNTLENVEQTKDCQQEPKPIEIEQEQQIQPEPENKIDEEVAKPRTGGARIVRPKQTVTVVQTTKNAKNETVVVEEKKVVEVGKTQLFKINLVLNNFNFF